MWRAFVLGTKSKNLYSALLRAEAESGRWISIAELRNYCVDRKNSPTLLPLSAVEFGFIAVPAVILRFTADITSSGSVVQAFMSKKRDDLY
jgi:hypothetical protein